MEKLMTRNVLKPFGSARVAFALAVGIPLLLVSTAFAQAPDAGTTDATAAAGAQPAQAEVERVVVTGSNIPTAEEVGPNPVDTYRKDDISRLGVRSSTDLVQRLPAASGSSINENNTNGGDGRAEINLRGILAKETLVLQDGRRVAPVGFAGSTADLNLFPVQLIDHVDILKDGASAIYGSDAVAGVFNIWLIHRYRGLEVGAQYGNTNMGFANDSAEEEGWLLAGTGDDKTDLVVFAEWYNRAGISSRDADISASSREFATFGGADTRSGNLAGRVGATRFSGLTNSIGSRGYYYLPTLNTVNPGSKHPTAHAFPNVQSDPEYDFVAATTKSGGAVGASGQRIKQKRFLFNFNSITPAIAPVDREYFYGSFTRDICDKYLTAFADFKYARTFWDSGLAGAPFTPDVWADNGGFVNNTIGGNPLSRLEHTARVSAPRVSAFRLKTHSTRSRWLITPRWDKTFRGIRILARALRQLELSSPPASAIAVSKPVCEPTRSRRTTGCSLPASKATWVNSATT